MGTACLVAGLTALGLVFNPSIASSMNGSSLPEAKPMTKVDALLSQMTLQEKIGQLSLLTSGWDVTGPTLRDDYRDQIKAGRVGNLFNAHTVEYARELQKLAVEQTRLGIPLLFGYDVIHGYKTVFPIPLGESSSWDLQAMEASARVAAKEASAAGVNWTFAPMVDIARDPRWGRVSEGAGEDTFLGMQIARARVRGFQGADLGAPDTVLACAKHFAGYGAAQAGRDYHTVDMSRRELFSTYLPPFKAAVDEGVGTFMTAFNELDGVPATSNQFLLQDVLRKRWGFEGFVVTDYTAIPELIPHGVARDGKHAAQLAFQAGVDIDMQGMVFHDNLEKLVHEGSVTMEQIDGAVRRVLTLKQKLGLLDDPYRYLDAKREQQTVRDPSFRQIARDVARKSIVLLKNNGALPLARSAKSVALIGPLADSKIDMLGSWHAAGDASHAVTLREGLAGKLGPHTKLTYAKGSDYDGTDRSGFTEAVEAARNADVVVMAVGEKWDWSGEAASRANIEIPQIQKELMAEVKKTGKPVVMVLMNGRPLALSWEDQHMDAIVEAWYLGEQGGHAIADVLVGDYNPSGKLTMTFPRSVGQVPVYYNMKNTGRPFDADNKYTSKYLDVPNSPLYPFGYGLSYTSFSYGEPQLDKRELGPNGSLTVSVDVKNTGTRDGEEVVQLYVQDVVGSVTRPVRELKGYRKLMIPAGQSRRVQFTIQPRDLAFYRADMTFGTEEGEFRLFVGGDSNASRQATFRLTQAADFHD